jgi:hypothetical protein
MNRRPNLLTFISALIPGVGQIVLGLYKRGIQLFALYILIRPVLSVVGLGSIGSLLKIIIWCYAFFDTFDLARRMERGEHIEDTEFIFEKHLGNEFTKGPRGFSLDKNLWMICGWGLIVVGILAIINLTFNTNDLYGIIKSYINMYFIPIVLVVVGFFMLFKYKR